MTTCFACHFKVHQPSPRPPRTLREQGSPSFSSSRMSPPSRLCRSDGSSSYSSSVTSSTSSSSSEKRRSRYNREEFALNPIFLRATTLDAPVPRLASRSTNCGPEHLRHRHRCQKPNLARQLWAASQQQYHDNATTAHQ